MIAELEALQSDADPPQPNMSIWLPIMNLELLHNGRSYRFFSTITSLCTPLDAAVQELRLESLFPADKATRQPRVRSDLVYEPDQGSFSPWLPHSSFTPKIIAPGSRFLLDSRDQQAYHQINY